MVGQVQSRWGNEECRFEDGVYFADDTVVLLEGSPAAGYRVLGREPLRTLTKADPDGWTGIDRRCAIEHQGVHIVGGGGSWEGEGFLAAVDAATGQLSWLLHLSGSEPFVEVRVDGPVVRAVSGEYPHRIEWTIPLADPPSLLVSDRSGNPAP